jgi:uncharacterized protein YjiS (DUF1127 family)
MSTLLDYSAAVPPNRSGRPSAQPHQSSSWQALFTAPLRWMERRWGRHALKEIIDDPRTLSDVGLTREQVVREINKPFWS